MARLLQRAPATAVGRARGAAALTLGALALAGLFALTDRPREPQALPAAQQAPATPPLAQAAAPADIAAKAVGAAPAPATHCALQSLQLTLGSAPARTICMAATVVQQTGGVRSYLVAAGDAEGFSLQVDTSQRRVLSVRLQARDGRVQACEAPGCGGLARFVEPVGAGAGWLDLRALRLTAPAGAGRPAEGPQTALLTAQLQVPADEQLPGLACGGPSLGIAGANGALRRFCAQGGAGIEFADNGQQVYRLQDHEGRTLTVAVEPEAQRIASVSWEGRSCEAAACRGASTTSSDPANPLAERSFFFGRTPLFEPGRAAGAGAAPAVVLDGTLVAPAQ